VLGSVPLAAVIVPSNVPTVVGMGVHISNL
jgi:hypothetical protein